MALPSSPPLYAVAMDVDGVPPSSPPLPALALALPPSRKRQLSEYDSNFSSDPLFSEGTTDSDDAADDRPRRKRMVRGPWWSMGKRPAREEREDPALKDDARNVDSGVWMGSDESEESSASLVASQRKMQDLRVTAAPSHGTRVMAEKKAAAHTCKVRHVDQVAGSIIDECVEHGKEAVDLSGLDLKVLSQEILRPLHQLIRHAHISMTEPPSEDQYTPLKPELKLFLNGNQLEDLPAELFLLENTTVLSLRNNNLSNLPPSICRLKLLKELNIAGNQIHYLPWELLTFLECRDSPNRITIRPNPLVEALERSSNDRNDLDQDAVHDHTRTELDSRLQIGRSQRAESLEQRRLAGEEIPSCREELIYLASSRVRYFDVAGRPCRKAKADDDLYPLTLDVANDLPASATLSKSPSLFELALQCTQKEYDLETLPAGLPAVVATALNKAARTVEVGNQKCTACQRGFVIPRAEWMEFWFFGPDSQKELLQETVLPFLRKACSWACATPTAVGGFR